MSFLRAITPFEVDESDFDDAAHGLRRRVHRKPWRAGFGAQTVVADLDDIKVYKLFERTIVSRISPRSAVELELAYRLASLFWRLRRASAIEAGLFQIQAEAHRSANRRAICKAGASATQKTPTRPAAIGSTSPSSRFAVPPINFNHPAVSAELASHQHAASSDARTAARCFIRLFHQAPDLLDRAAAHESRLWRQAAHVIWVLDALRHPSPQHRIPRRANISTFRRIAD
jgi:hypothetical protein